jgi:SAM-dependent methyltransferase
MRETVFNSYARYYDLLYRDKDYVAEAEFIADLLERFGISGKRLLEFGSGTGKHGRLLAKRGYDVTGVERSAEMVAQAKVAPGFSCQQGDICTVQLGQTFDAVLSLFHVVSYQTTNEAVKAVFTRAAEHLQNGGLFVFDVWYSPAVYAQKPEVRVKRIASEEIEITRIAEPVSHPNKNCVDVNYTIFACNLASGAVEIMNETHPMRHFSLSELDLLAQMSGFAVVGTEEFLTGNIPSEKTWGVCLILKRVF